MVATSRKPSRGAVHRGRRPVPLADHLAIVRRLEHGLGDAYDFERIGGNVRSVGCAWRVNVTVPVYGAAFSLRIDFELPYGFGTSVVAENWTGDRLHHAFGQNRLCLWYPSDPPSKQWNSTSESLLKLVDLSVAHLFRELYHREFGVWPGEEAPHDVPKVEPDPPRLPDDRKGVFVGR